MIKMKPVLLKTLIRSITVTGMLCLAGCRQGAVVQDVPNLSVSLKGAQEGMPFDLSEMVGRPRKIALQIDEALAPAAVLKYVRGRYYLTDTRRKTIYAFNEQGEAVLALNRSGRAGYEYVKMLGFDVNPANGEIHVYDSGTRRFLVYSETGDFLRAVKPEDKYAWFRDFAVLEDGSYLVYIPDYLAQGYPSGLFALDQEGTFVRSWSTLDPDIRHKVLSEPYVNFRRLSDGTLSLRSEQDKNDVYHIDAGGGFTTAYHLDFDVTMSSEVRKSEFPSTEDASYYYIMNWFETDHWLGLVVVYLNEQVLVYYNKETSECHYGRTEKGRLKLSDLLIREPGDPYTFMFSAGDRLMYLKTGSQETDRPEIIVYPEHCLCP